MAALLAAIVFGALHGAFQQGRPAAGAWLIESDAGLPARPGRARTALRRPCVRGLAARG